MREETRNSSTKERKKKTFIYLPSKKEKEKLSFSSLLLMLLLLLLLKKNGAMGGKDFFEKWKWKRVSGIFFLHHLSYILFTHSNNNGWGITRASIYFLSLAFGAGGGMRDWKYEESFFTFSNEWYNKKIHSFHPFAKWHTHHSNKCGALASHSIFILLWSSPWLYFSLLQK